MIKCVLFDFAGVTVNKPFLEWGTEKAGSDEALSQKLRKLADEGMDTGRLSLTEYLEAAGKLVKLDALEVHSQLIAKVRPQKQVIALARYLREIGVISALLSNINQTLLTDMLFMHGIRNCFSAVFASSEYKLVKPDPQLFRLVLDELHCDPEEVAYFDDTSRHVWAASWLGIQARHYTSPEQMWSDLCELGVII